MDFNARLQGLVSEMKLNVRYRTFHEPERLAGEFPTALWHRQEGETQRVTVWCSNDYLRMGQHPDVLAAMHKAIDSEGAGTGGTRNISGNNQCGFSTILTPAEHPPQQWLQSAPAATKSSNAGPLLQRLIGQRGVSAVEADAQSFHQNEHK